MQREAVAQVHQRSAQTAVRGGGPRGWWRSVSWKTGGSISTFLSPRCSWEYWRDTNHCAYLVMYCNKSSRGDGGGGFRGSICPPQLPQIFEPRRKELTCDTEHKRRRQRQDESKLPQQQGQRPKGADICCDRTVQVSNLYTSMVPRQQACESHPGRPSTSPLR